MDILKPEQVAHLKEELLHGRYVAKAEWFIVCESHEALRQRAEYLIGALTEIRLNMNGDRFVEAGKRQMYLRVIDAALAGVGDV